MNSNPKKLVKLLIPFFLIIFPFVFSFIIEDLFEDAIQISVLAVLIVFVVFAIIFKRSFCGFLCMVGTSQRIIGKIGFKILKKRLAVPAVLDKYLRAGKYVLLGGVAVLSVVYGKLLLQMSVDDVFEIYNMLFPGLAWLSVVMLFVTIIGSFFIDNFFCKYFCVQGAVAGVAGRFSPGGIVRYEDTCINCKLCTKTCPSNLEVHKMQKVVSAECFNCQQCIVVCPKNGALTNSIAGIKIPFVLFVVMAGIFFFVSTFLIPLFYKMLL